MCILITQTGIAGSAGGQTGSSREIILWTDVYVGTVDR